ncbi:uncharacterized protein LOC111035824 [Myzus persicae]|uniref:uncharacterized protein LOC111035824 n=1 Tax=Myzus persicae TaxID=13164 RepID=UPI000B939DCF|nr:uncharacterized protein LOC111035824 [Myzus persicae]
MTTTVATAAAPRPRRTVLVGVPRPTAAVAVLAAVVVAAAGGGGVYAKLMSTRQAACTLSEFECSSSSSTVDEDDDDVTTAAAVRCVPSIKYCDGRRDCPDGSDEPHYCTPCNRTYYGDVGKTYEFELHRPKPDKLPFVCFIKLVAPGHHLGDLIQVTLDSFTIGRFASYTNAGCPDGDLHITESDRPAVSGGWCGTSWAPAHYYSETNSITLLVRLYTLSSLDNTGYNFDFRLGYKMLNRNRAVVRYGEQKMFARVNESFHMGDLMEGTYCSRIFSNCDKKRCVLQSPNYPGLYPRNLTCYYAIRQHSIPYGHQALISITQPYSRLVSIKTDRTNPEGADPKPVERKDWSKCDNVPDFVTVYDGYTTRDPILLRFCGSGETVPVTTSSGPELLVQFSTSPYGTLMYPFGPLHGFQLQVQVHFVEIESIKYTKNKRCEFWIRNTGRGWLHAPYHSLPENTTCWYHLQATPAGVAAAGYPVDRESGSGPRYKVWVSVLKFYVTGPQTRDCTTNLMVWDGNSSCHPFCDSRNASSSAYQQNNSTLLANYCPGQTPRSCDHFLLTRQQRPCTLSESFLSTSRSLTVQLNIQHATALRPVSFKALYEFVDLHQDGSSWPETGSMCSRIFRRPKHSPSSTIAIRSPKNVFFYGRGGNKNLSCVFRLEGQPGDVAKVTILSIGSGDRSCYSRLNKDRGTLQCVGDIGSSLSVLDEVNGPKTMLVPRHCLCSTNASLLPYTFVTLGSKASMVWDVSNMNSTEDFRLHYFEASVQFVRREVVPKRCEVKSNLLSGPGGHFTFHSHHNTTCESHFVILTQKKYTNSYLYAKLPGLAMPDSSHAVPNNTQHVHCPTNNRFIVHAGDTVHTVVCPDPYYTVEVFSDGWHTRDVMSNSSRDIVIEFIPIDPGSYTVSWIQLSSRIRADGPYCHSQCPELDACINESLWCDGVEHCPSGYDESFGYCMHLLYTHLVYSIALTVAIIIVAVSSGLTVLWFRRFRSASSAAAGCRSPSAKSAETEAVVSARDVVY